MLQKYFFTIEVVCGHDRPMDVQQMLKKELLALKRKIIKRHKRDDMTAVVKIREVKRLIDL